MTGPSQPDYGALASKYGLTISETPLTAPPVDYEKLAQTHGLTISDKPPSPAQVDYGALAKKYGLTLSDKPPSAPSPDYAQLAQKHGLTISDAPPENQDEPYDPEDDKLEWALEHGGIKSVGGPQGFEPRTAECAAPPFYPPGAREAGLPGVQRYIPPEISAPPVQELSPREGGFSPTRQTLQAIEPAGAQAAISQAWSPSVEDLKGQTPSTEFAAGIARAVISQASAKNLSWALAGIGGGQILKAAASLPRVLAAVEGSPGAAKALDVAASNLIPAAFASVAGTAGVKSGIEAGKSFAAGKTTEATGQATEAVADIILAALGGYGVKRGVAETAAEHPPAPSPEAQALAEKTGGIATPEVTAEEAQARATALQAQGKGLAAQSWQELAAQKKGAFSLSVDTPNGPVTITKTFTHPKYGDSYKAVDADGNVVKAASGKAEQVQNWLRINAPDKLLQSVSGTARVVAPEEPSAVQQVIESPSRIKGAAADPWGVAEVRGSNVENSAQPVETAGEPTIAPSTPTVGEAPAQIPQITPVAAEKPQVAPTQVSGESPATKGDQTPVTAAPVSSDTEKPAETAPIPPTSEGGTPAAASTEKKTYDFSSTQTNLPDPLAKRITAYASRIPDSHLAADEGSVFGGASASTGRETQPHVTVLYGLHTQEAADVEKLLAGEQPITAKLGKASLFPASETGKADVLKVDVESPDLHRLNAKIAAELPHTDTHPLYQPHVTIAYLKPGEGAQYAGKPVPGVTGQTVTLNSVRFSSKNGQQADIPLGKTLPTAGPGVEEGPTITPIKNLPAEESAVQARSIAAVTKDPAGFVARYRGRFGNRISADSAAELFPEYSASDAAREKNRTAVARAASWIADRAFAERLKQPDSAPVVFMAGGTGSGKSIAAGLLLKEGAIVYDSTLSDHAGAKRQIQAAVDAGRNVSVEYIYRDPADAYKAVLQRAKGEEGAGRIVTPLIHAITHERAASTVRELAKEFKDNPNVQFRYFNNTGKPGGYSQSPIELTSKGDYTDIRKRIADLDAEIRRTQPEGTGGSPGETDGGVGQPLRGQPGPAPQGKSGNESAQPTEAPAAAAAEVKPKPQTPAEKIAANNKRIAELEAKLAGQKARKPEIVTPAPTENTLSPPATPERTIEAAEPHATHGTGRENPPALGEVPPQDVRGATEVGATGTEHPEGGPVDQRSDGGTGGEGSAPQPGLGDDQGAVGVSPRGERPATPRRAAPGEPSADYRITPADQIGAGTVHQKALDNLQAIRTLKAIEAAGRSATPDEQKALVKYVGWGGMPQPFVEYGMQREWQGVRAELDGLLTEDEFKSARASTPNAHYTSPVVIQGMWDAVKHLGVIPEEGALTVIEPAMGVGHFFGLMPEPESVTTSRTGIELDSLTGRIAKLLYPQADVHVAGFEQVREPDNYFDLAISNVPFGNYGVHDPAYKRTPILTKSIHDYFFAKALDKVRPGGVVAFITSSFTMDKRDPSVRNYLAERANLLGAIRLPNTAFKGNAGTEVTTDIIFLQKKAAGQAEGAAWTELKPIQGTTKRPDGSQGTAQMEVNEYYAAHPEMMLGKMGLVGTMYGPDKSAALIGDLTPDNLRAAVNRLPANVIKPWEAPPSVSVGSALDIPAGTIKQGAYALHDGQLVVRHGDQLRPEAVAPEKAARIKGMMMVRDAMREVYGTQIREESDTEIKKAREKLNRVYDSFVKAHGFLHTRANVAAFQSDPDAPPLLSLENWDEDAKKATKADVFRTRTIPSNKPITKANSALDALSVSLNEHGRLDWARMQQLTGRTPAELQAELGPAIYRNPAGKAWETADEYLAGNVRKKFAEAQAAVRTDPSYQRNVEALQAVQPKDLLPEEIGAGARLGASWIPKQDVQQWISDLLQVPPRSVHIGHSEALGSWTVALDTPGVVSNQTTYGTGRYAAHELIEDALNLRNPTVYDTVGSGADAKTVVNQTETLAARETQQQLKDRFANWAWEEPGRAARLAEIYNTEFNSDRLWQPDGAHLNFPGMNAGITLKPHQKNAVWRVLRGPNTLFAHVVGAGKTYEMIAAAMEARRIGLFKKPMHVVPKNRVPGHAEEFLKLYPAANILVMSSEDFTSKNRQQIMGRIASGNWDSVIVSYESFAKLPISDETFNEYLRGQIDELENYILEAKADKSDAKIVKELEKSKKRLEAKLRGKADREAKDTGLSFEELGVDMLLVDEADSFKNLFFPTKMTRIAGIPNTESKRAFDMFIKTQHISKRNNGRGIVFATGTPIANSMAEMWTMQRYLQPQYLRDHGLQHFDAWAQTFGEVRPTLEMSPDGSGYRMANRFSRFVNIPELVQGFRQMADVQTADMLKLPIPTLKTGESIIHAAKASDAQNAYLKTLAARAQQVAHKPPTKGGDNILVIGTDGQKAALDMRMVDPNAVDHPGSKVNLAIDEVVRIWKETTPKRSTQLIFLDISRPAEPGEKKFSVSDDIKAKLIKRGIPAKEIAFIHDAETDAQKTALFAKVNDGQVRVVIGSTMKMGVGLNVQVRLIAEHHLDAPHRPRDIEQRRGRMLRQGNTNPQVEDHVYVTEPSFDARKWDILKTKAYFINQVMRGDVSVRNAEDIGDSSLSYGEVAAIASGNPAIREKTIVDAEVRKLDAMRARHDQQQAGVKRDMEQLPQRIRAGQAMAAEFQTDIATRDAHDPVFTIGKETFTGKDARKRAGEALQKVLEAHRGDEKMFRNATLPRSLPLGNYRGLPLEAYYYISDVFDGSKKKEAKDIRLPEIVIHGAASYGAATNQYGDPDGTLTSIEAIVRNIEGRLNAQQTVIAADEKKLADTRELAGKPFAQDAKLKTLLAKQADLAKQLQTAAPDPQAMLGADEPEEEGGAEGESTEEGEAPAEERAPSAGIENYKPGTGRIATPVMAGHGVEGWMHGEANGKRVYSNGHILLVGTPPGPALTQDTPNMGKVLKPQGALTPAKPVAFSPKTKDHVGAVWFEDGTAIDSKYFDHVSKRVPDASFATAKTAQGQKAVFIESKGETVGLIMPVKFDPPESVREILKRFATEETGTSNVIPRLREALEAFREAMDSRSDKQFGEKLRTFVTGARDVEIAETNQLRERLKRLVPDPVDQEALSLMRDFKNRPDEMKQFLAGTHDSMADLAPDARDRATALLKQLRPVITRALEPTAAMVDADQQMTRYFEEHLEKGRELGFVDSTLSNEEYITHLLTPKAQAPGPIKRILGSGKIGPRSFKFAKERKIPTLLHAIAYGVRPRTLNALDALTIYGEKFAKTAAARMLVNELKETAMGQWGTRSGQRSGKVPQGWTELAPESRMFRNEVPFLNKEGEAEVAHQMLFVPEEVSTALQPIFDPNYLSRVPFFMSARMYQAYIKTVELGLSFFHLKALSVTGLNNESLKGLVDTMRSDMSTREFEQSEQDFIQHGGTTTILGRTEEAYRALSPTSIPTTGEKIRALPGIHQAEQVAGAITRFTFDVVQRKFKVTDYSLKAGAWGAKHPNASDQAKSEARRLIAKEINAAYGGLHWENLGVHRVTLELTKALFLAPDWTFSNILNAKYAFEGGPGGNAARIFWLKSLIFGLAMTAAMSLLLTRKLAKDPTQVHLGRDRQGKDIYDNMFFVGAPGDAVNLLRNIKDYGAILGVAKTIGAKLGPIARTGEHLVTNTDALGRPIVKKGSGFLKATGKGVEELGKNLAPVPFSVSTVASMLMDKKHKYTEAQYVSAVLNGRIPHHATPPAHHAAAR